MAARSAPRSRPDEPPRRTRPGPDRPQPGQGQGQGQGERGRGGSCQHGRLGLAVLPGRTSGWDPTIAPSWAEPLDGPCITAVRAAALTGRAENVVLAPGPDGQVCGNYTKAHLFATPSGCADPPPRSRRSDGRFGSEPLVIEVDGTLLCAPSSGEANDGDAISSIELSLAGLPDGLGLTAVVRALRWCAVELTGQDIDLGRFRRLTRGLSADVPDPAGPASRCMRRVRRRRPAERDGRGAGRCVHPHAPS